MLQRLTRQNPKNNQSETQLEMKLPWLGNRMLAHLYGGYCAVESFRTAVVV